MNGRDDRDDGYPGGGHPDASEGGDGLASYELAGYDEYGRPVYQQASPDAAPSRQAPADGHYGASHDFQGGAYGTTPEGYAYAAPADGYGTPQGYEAYGAGQSYGTQPFQDAQAFQTPGRFQDAQAFPAPEGFDPFPDPQASYGTQTPYGSPDVYPDPAAQGYPTAPAQEYAPAPAQEYGYAPATAPAAVPDHDVPPPDGGPDPYADAGPDPYAPAWDAVHGDGTPAGEPGPQVPPPRADDPYAELGALDPENAKEGDPSAERRRHQAGQFAFVDDPDPDPEDVIDWLTFTENRTERREEAKRRARGRGIALGTVLALVVVGFLGYLGFTGALSGDDDSSGAAASGPQKRDVVLVHLHDTKKGGTSTALLVDNTTTKQGSTILLPNALAVSADDGTATTLAKSVEDDGSTGTRSSVDTLLGTSIEGTWRLDTPYLNNLVELVGGIEVDTDAEVPAPKAKKDRSPLVQRGERQSLNGPMAVAYATHRASGEPEDAQLARFGQVMQGVLRKLSSDAEAATVTVQSLAQILDPSLTEKDLGAFLARLSDRAKGGDHKTALLPVAPGGALAPEATRSVVKPLLGGTVKKPAEGDALRVGVRGAQGTGGAEDAESARIALVNGGYTVVDGGKGTAPGTTRVVYADAAHRAEATEVAKTLGLPASAAAKGTVEGNAQIEVVLGRDYEPQPLEGQ
ncbi:LytR C-terminal domain-containing protein [Streptomyces sp. JNUCC 64]